MAEWLREPGFFGTHATIGADVSQFMATLFTFLFVIGWIQAKRGHSTPHHGLMLGGISPWWGVLGPAWVTAFAIHIFVNTEHGRCYRVGEVMAWMARGGNQCHCGLSNVFPSICYGVRLATNVVPHGTGGERGQFTRSYRPEAG